VNPSEGSVAGGTEITITGRNFDDTDKPIDVSIAGKFDFFTIFHSDPDSVERI